MTIQWSRKRLHVQAEQVLYGPAAASTRRLSRIEPGCVSDVDNGSGRKERAGPPPGGPVRKIRKNSVLPGSGPTDLHFGKNGIVHKNIILPGPGGPVTSEVRSLTNPHEVLWIPSGCACWRLGIRPQWRCFAPRAIRARDLDLAAGLVAGWSPVRE